MHLFRGISDPLNKLINNGMMKESLAREAELADVDPEVSTLFVRYCYTAILQGNLEVKAQTKTVQLKCICQLPKGTRARVIAHDTWLEHAACGQWLASYTKPVIFGPTNAVTGRSKAAAWEDFKNMKFESTATDSQVVGMQNQSLKSADNPSHNLINHVKLFIFADQWMVQPLKAQCLHDLHRDLISYNVQEDGGFHIAELIRYSYALPNETMLSFVANGLGLRRVVTRYAVLQAESLIKTDDFRSLMEDGGEFVTSFTDLMVEFLAEKKD